jgi:opacity protein-like surface antigen
MASLCNEGGLVSPINRRENMKKLILAAAAVTLMSGSAFAVEFDASACPALPGAGWSWTGSASAVESGGETSTDTSSETYYVGAKKGTNGFEVTTTTTTTSDLILTTTTQCVAVNPAGKTVPGESTTVVTIDVLQEGGSSSLTSDPVKVCGPNLTACAP